MSFTRADACALQPRGQWFPTDCAARAIMHSSFFSSTVGRPNSKEENQYTHGFPWRVVNESIKVIQSAILVTQVRVNFESLC